MPKTFTTGCATPEQSDNTTAGRKIGFTGKDSLISDSDMQGLSLPCLLKKGVWKETQQSTQLQEEPFKYCLVFSKHNKLIVQCQLSRYWR